MRCKQKMVLDKKIYKTIITLLEINVLKELKKDLIEMNSIESIDMDFVFNMLSEYISIREYNITHGGV